MLFIAWGPAYAVSLQGMAKVYASPSDLISINPITGDYDAAANTLQFDPFLFFGLQLQTTVTDLVGPGTYTRPVNGIPTTTDVGPNQMGAYMTITWGVSTVQTVMVWNVAHGPSGDSFTAADSDGDGVPGQQFNAGPFPGFTLAYDFSTGAGAPGVDVSVAATGGNRQECSATGGSTVDLTADVHLLGGARLANVQWYVDGVSAGTGTHITPFLKLGSHHIQAVATITTGTTASASTSVNVVDTTPPQLTAGFVDVRTGEPISAVNGPQAQFVGVSVHATDVCDSAPTTKATVVPAFAVKDGDTIKIQGKTGQVDLATSALTLTATGTDASGNSASAQAVLDIQP
ncbi:MAG: hypothetical protein WCC36_02385 [Gammaproteobacteria bacterium]